MKSKVAITKVTISLQKEKAQTDFICGRCDLFQQRHEGLMEDARARARARVCVFGPVGALRSRCRAEG